MTRTATVRPNTVSEALRAAVLDQSLAPGTTVTESSVAMRFAVSRPTARIAIDQLVAAGMLHRAPHAAARVPELGRADIQDVFDNRSILEGAAVAALANAGVVPAEAVAAHRELIAHPNDFARPDIAFHRALGSGQPSPRLAQLHALLMGEVELCIGQVQANHLLDARVVISQHQGILDAIVAGDSRLADSLTRAHIDGARDALLTHYDTTYDTTHHDTTHGGH